MKFSFLSRAYLFFLREKSYSSAGETVIAFWNRELNEVSKELKQSYLKLSKSRKLSKLDEPELQDTDGEAGTSS